MIWADGYPVNTYNVVSHQRWKIDSPSQGVNMFEITDSALGSVKIQVTTVPLWAGQS